MKLIPNNKHTKKAVQHTSNCGYFSFMRSRAQNSKPKLIELEAYKKLSELKTLKLTALEKCKALKKKSCKEIL